MLPTLAIGFGATGASMPFDERRRIYLGAFRLRADGISGICPGLQEFFYSRRSYV